MPLTAPVRLVDRRGDRLRVRAEQVMGTVASLHLHDPEVPETAVDAAFEHLHDIDWRFSVFREDSEIRRLERGDLVECNASADVREVLAACERLRESTGGVFDIRRHRGPRTLDPSGYVKGWATEAAARILLAAGARTFYLGVGGVALGCLRPHSSRKSSSSRSVIAWSRPTRVFPACLARRERYNRRREKFSLPSVCHCE